MNIDEALQLSISTESQRNVAAEEQGKSPSIVPEKHRSQSFQSRSRHRPCTTLKPRSQGPPPVAPSESSFGNVDRLTEPGEGRRKTQPIAPRSPSKSDALPSPSSHRVEDRQLNDVFLERDNSSTRTAIPIVPFRTNPPAQPFFTKPPTSPPEISPALRSHIIYASPNHPTAFVPPPFFPTLAVGSLALRRPEDPTSTPDFKSILAQDQVLGELLETIGRKDVGEEVKKVLQVAIEKRAGEIGREAQSVSPSSFSRELLCPTSRLPWHCCIKSSPRKSTEDVSQPFEVHRAHACKS